MKVWSHGFDDIVGPFGIVAISLSESDIGYLVEGKERLSINRVSSYFFDKSFKVVLDDERRAHKCILLTVFFREVEAEDLNNMR